MKRQAKMIDTKLPLAKRSPAKQITTIKSAGPEALHFR
jgi:hypothetical protein